MISKLHHWDAGLPAAALLSGQSRCCRKKHSVYRVSSWPPYFWPLNFCLGELVQTPQTSCLSEAAVGALLTQQILYCHSLCCICH